MHFFLDIPISCVLYSLLIIDDVFGLEQKKGTRMSYLICDKRKGSQKVHVEVCRRKCKLVQECKAYKQFVDELEKKAA